MFYHLIFVLSVVLVIVLFFCFADASDWFCCSVQKSVPPTTGLAVKMSFSGV